MDKRVVLAAVMAIVILFGWKALEDTIWPPPEPAPEPPQPALTEPLDPTEPQEILAAPSERPDADLPPEVETPAIAAADAEEIVIETDLYRVTLTNEGGRALSWQMLSYPNSQGQPLELLPRFAEAGSSFLGVDLDDRNLAHELNTALYQFEREMVPAGDDKPRGERLILTWANTRGVEARKAFTFREGSYLIDVELDITDRGRQLPARLVIGPGFGAQEKTSNYSYEATTWDRAGQVRHQQKGDYGNDILAETGNLMWAGLHDQYFAALVLPGVTPATFEILPRQLTRTESPDPEKEPETAVERTLSVSVGSDGGGLFLGPKSYKELQAHGEQLDRVLWFFSNGLLDFISSKIYLGLLWIHDNVVANYGMAIILATFLLRLMLFPVNQYSMVSMKKAQLQMSRLQPKIKAIRAKYKGKKGGMDAEGRAKMNQEMMELYRKEGVNPMGGVSGCLPLLAQFPILIGFYGMLTYAVELKGAPFFGWIQDLSQADPYWVTPILMGVTMFVQQKMSMSKIKDPQQMQQQRIMMIMPFVFTYICLSLPSGLVIYWFINNLLGIGQQWLVNRHTSRLEAAAQKA